MVEASGYSGGCVKTIGKNWKKFIKAYSSKWTLILSGSFYSYQFNY
jgi:hypothetical protein